MNYDTLGGKLLKWIVIAATTLMAMHLFFVQQLIAAFLIFSVLFVCTAVVILVLFALDLAWRTALGRAEAYLVVVGRSVLRGRASAHN